MACSEDPGGLRPGMEAAKLGLSDHETTSSSPHQMVLRRIASGCEEKFWEDRQFNKKISKSLPLNPAKIRAPQLGLNRYIGEKAVILSI